MIFAFIECCKNVYIFYCILSYFIFSAFIRIVPIYKFNCNKFRLRRIIEVNSSKKLINIFVITRKWKQPVEIHITLQNINMHRSPILFKLDLVVSMNKTIYDVQFDVFQGVSISKFSLRSRVSTSWPQIKFLRTLSVAVWQCGCKP